MEAECNRQSACRAVGLQAGPRTARDPGRKRGTGRGPRAHAHADQPQVHLGFGFGLGWTPLFRSFLTPRPSRAHVGSPGWLPPLLSSPLLRDPGTVPSRRADSSPPRLLHARISRLLPPRCDAYTRRRRRCRTCPPPRPLRPRPRPRLRRRPGESVSNRVPLPRASPVSLESSKARLRRSHAPGLCVSAVRMLMALPGMALESAPTAWTAAPR